MKCDNCNDDVIVGFKLEFFTEHCNYEVQDTKSLCFDCAEEQNFAIDLIEHLTAFDKEGKTLRRELI